MGTLGKHWKNGPHSEEHKRKLKENHKGMTGRHQKEETKIKISNSEKGKYVSPEQRKNISEAHKGYITSEKTKLKLRMVALNYIKNIRGNVSPNIGHNERQILDNLEKEIGYKIVRQFECEGYFIDGYIPELNMCIEIDEKQHIKKKERDTIRQVIIRNKIGCIFMRVHDYV